MNVRVLLAACSLLLLQKVAAQAPLLVYTDALVNGFQNWSWAPNNSSATYAGTNCISVSATNWQALWLEHSDFSTTPYANLGFWLNGGAGGGQVIRVFGMLDGNAQSVCTLGALSPNTWGKFTIPFSALAIVGRTNCDGFCLQLADAGSTNTFYVADVQLGAVPAPTLTHIGINATAALRVADPRWFAVNTAIWDSNFDTPTTISLLQEMGTRVLRCPGGSLSDQYNWSTGTNLTNTWQWVTSFANFVHVATNVGAQAIITVNYGTGSSNEAAAWVAYANGTTTNSLSLGVDQFGTKWWTVGYWASLRAAAPLGKDDGKNFLRLSRTAPLGFKYWEIGNECYGTWETDSNAVPNDPYTYATRARDYCNLMKAVDDTIKVGVVVTPGESSCSNNASHYAVNPRTGTTNYGWTPVMLATLKSLGTTPDFGIHHRYPEYTDPNNPVGSDSDVFLLQCSTQWALDAADLRQQISDYFGPTGTNVELVCTENNSDAGAQGKQSTSLVNGLYYADSLGHLMQTEFNALVWWDLRNGTDTSGCFDDALYGWRTYGDLGMVNGLNTRHPTFYAAKLMQFFAQPGDTILSASSDYSLLAAYAARRASGALSLLVLNKDTMTAFNAQIALTGFSPCPVATLRSYGIPQDEAARTNGTAQAQDIAVTNFPAASAGFGYSFPPLSLTLFTFAPAAPCLAVLPSVPQPGCQCLVQLQGQPGVRYFIQCSTNLSSTNLSAWTTVSTNTLVANTLNFTNPVPAGAAARFWRALWQP
ncbi:MAG: alpha-L-arabinofuranosidase [Limisphaerales bacterium]